MQIIIHRGTHQIGGCITEIRTQSARIIIDIGAELPSIKSKNLSPEINGVTCGTPDCDAVFVTHYHGDHVGMFEKVLSEIPIYMGHTAKEIYGIVQKTLQSKLNKGNPERIKTFKDFSIGKPIFIKDIKVTPYVIDHSAYDAYMFLIEAEGKRILHTGDFRMHGSRGNKMPCVFEKYAQDIDVLITEGTMLSRMSESIMSEHELGVKAKQLLRDNRYAFVLCSSTNIDTIAEFYHAAIATNRPFIVCEDDFQGKILQIVTSSSTSPFYQFDRKKIYTYGNNLHNFMSERGFVFMGRTNYVTQKAIEKFPDSLLIYSMWSGYLDQTHPAFDEYKKAFVDRALHLGCRMEYLHTSGHAGAKDILKVCEITHAKTLIPIHCEEPKQFHNIGVNANIQILQDGEVYSF